jgi:hypothetical protein
MSMDDHEYIPASKRVGPPSPWVILADALHPLAFRISSNPKLAPSGGRIVPLDEATRLPAWKAKAMARRPALPGSQQDSLGKAMPLGTAVRYLRCLEERAAVDAHLVPHNRA